MVEVPRGAVAMAAGAATAAGMQAVWFAHEEIAGSVPAAAAGVPPDHVIGSLPELLLLPAVRRAPR